VPAEFTPLVKLGDTTECVKCQHYLLPGQAVDRVEVPYAIHSDLPEIFESVGVLYATFPVLPPFDTHKDGPLAEEMRRQINQGYTAIDGSFEVFLYHLSVPGGGVEPRKLVVYVVNEDAEHAVELEPHVAVHAAGQMAAADGPEMRLARQVFAREFEVATPVRIEPGKGGVLTVTPAIAAVPEGMNAGFLNGIVRGIVTSESTPKLQIAVVAIPAATEPDAVLSTVESLLGQGAKSGETGMDLRIAPPPCHLRRVVGVYKNFEWHGAARLNVLELPENNLRFQMALPSVQAVGCEAGRQTRDMLLSPPYVRQETIGNYTIEYLVQLELVNPSAEPVTIDLRYGKQDASVGLVWRTAVTDPATGDVTKSTADQSGWAGAWTKDDLPDNTRSFLEAPLIIPANSERHVTLDFHIAGTSSLPFQLHVIREQ
ncbi:MAG: DUF3370 family protein, partial [Candidatus Sumerlaeia bacterium]|nr:DUF3370 family protein [Candidatus Sumerlaeia bacterium]